MGSAGLLGPWHRAALRCRARGVCMGRYCRWICRSHSGLPGRFPSQLFLARDMTAVSGDLEEPSQRPCAKLVCRNLLREGRAPAIHAVCFPPATIKCKLNVIAARAQLEPWRTRTALKSWQVEMKARSEQGEVSITRNLSAPVAKGRRGVSLQRRGLPSSQEMGNCLEQARLLFPGLLCGINSCT